MGEAGGVVRGRNPAGVCLAQRLRHAWAHVEVLMMTWPDVALRSIGCKSDEAADTGRLKR